MNLYHDHEAFSEFIVAASNELHMEQRTLIEQRTFKLHSEYQPTGDQPQAIEALVKGFREGNQLQNPTLVIAHNKTLAGQLYGEFKEFFPGNAVEYFVF